MNWFLFHPLRFPGCSLLSCFSSSYFDSPYISTFHPFSSASPSYLLLFWHSGTPFLSNLCSPRTPKMDITLFPWASPLPRTALKSRLLSLFVHSEQLSTMDLTWWVRQPEYDLILTDMLSGKIYFMLWEGKRNTLAKINQNLPQKQHAKVFYYYENYGNASLILLHQTASNYYLQWYCLVHFIPRKKFHQSLLTEHHRYPAII